MRIFLFARSIWLRGGPKTLNPGTVNCPVVVNIDAYRALSPAHKQALDSSIDEALSHYIRNYRDNVLAKWDQILAQKSVVKVRFADSELDAFRAAAAPVRAQWIEEMNAQGYPARELYDLAQTALRDAR